jgi:hypothetical protein
MFQYILDEMQRASESRHRWQTNVSSVLLGLQSDIQHVSDRQDAAKENCRNHAELAESVRSVHQLLEGAFGNGGMVSDLASIRKTTDEIRQEQVIIKTQLTQSATDQEGIKAQLTQSATDQAGIKAILGRHEADLIARERDCTRIATAIIPTPEAWWLTQVKKHAVTALTAGAISALMFGAIPAAKQFMGIADSKQASGPSHAGP